MISLCCFLKDGSADGIEPTALTSLHSYAASLFTTFYLKWQQLCKTIYCSNPARSSLLEVVLCLVSRINVTSPLSIILANPIFFLPSIIASTILNGGVVLPNMGGNHRQHNYWSHHPTLRRRRRMMNSIDGCYSKAHTLQVGRSQLYHSGV